jgi:hypothetical protein
MKLEFSRQIFEKYPDFKFHWNSPIGSRFVQCGQTDKTGMTELMVPFRNFANAFKSRTPRQNLRYIHLHMVITINKITNNVLYQRKEIKHHSLYSGLSPVTMNAMNYLHICYSIPSPIFIVPVWPPCR